VEREIEFEDLKLNYVKSGNGTQIMLLFHGFGQDHRAYNHLTTALKEQYTFYCFDLFFHGKSTWGNGERPLEKEKWKEIISRFFTDNNIENFSVTGFSLGCRFALATIEAFAHKIENVFLIAPDGIKSRFWFRLATYPMLTRKVFKSMILHPRSFRILANAMNELHIMDRGLLKFAEHQMNTTEKRRRVYYSWVVFRHLKFDHGQFTELVNAHPISFTFIAGKQDHVIKAKSINSFMKLLKNCRVEMLNTGHKGLLKDPQLADIIMRLQS
jgi:pimeloyl-ACP methyl ester carboxylesterase